MLRDDCFFKADVVIRSVQLSFSTLLMISHSNTIVDKEWAVGIAYQRGMPCKLLYHMP